MTNPDTLVRAAPVRVGQEVVECMVDTRRPEAPARGIVLEVCTACQTALVKITGNGQGTETVPFDRFGDDRPQAHWRVADAGLASDADRAGSPEHG